MASINEKDFIINVGPGGTFQKSGKYQTVPEDIDRMFEKFQREDAGKIAVFFHGGLVDEANGVKAARNMYPVISEAGCSPVCFAWETGLVETIGNNLTKISETTLYNKLIKLILKRVTKKLGIISVVGRGGQNGFTEEQIQVELMKQEPFADYNQPGTAGRSGNISTPEELAGREPFLEAELAQEFEADVAGDLELQLAIQKTQVTTMETELVTGGRGVISFVGFVAHAVKIAYRIINRFIQKRDHGLFPTCVEEILREFYIAEIGAWVWKGMKDKADGMWESNEGRTGLNQLAGRYFLDKLAAYKKAKPLTKIHLIGHSAGSIAICHLLRHTSTINDSFRYNQLLFLAPACRADLFKKEAIDHLGRYDDLRIFTMTDDNECRDKMVPYFYTHSLLYLISGVLEDEGKSFDAHILGLQRNIGFADPYNVPELSAIHDYLYEDGAYRVSFSENLATTPAGMGTSALKHGDFDDDAATKNSITTILSL
ncbi:alpha/beta hydrolase [Pedobacter alluvionis]|uniref:Alpha/beta hydrolase n=1 Tax=Pedobacter alluvionis TaxID=475253 RepID=A0A497YCN0_9SPHI|nr:alpha/beta hydrolase [Pedobacter alluvionis]RLJ80227.1 alpha/beta hydrolase family protein DUF900 [Pedobacter alluvionis]TFB31507.1 alpha/beta hydrolase [Pedobacter alluvionis]